MTNILTLVLQGNEEHLNFKTHCRITSICLITLTLFKLFTLIGA